jgi:hypothetical protein
MYLLSSDDEEGDDEGIKSEEEEESDVLDHTVKDKDDELMWRDIARSRRTMACEEKPHQDV